MRSRVSFFTLLVVVVLFSLPFVAHAGIPFFGPIIPAQFATCPAGWGMLITVVNNIIQLLLTLAIVFVAPLMIAWAGFLFVVNPVNASGKEQAKKILTNTVVGIVIALAGWLIVDAIMVVLYNGSFGTWSQLVTSGGGQACLQQQGAPYQPGVVTPPPTVGVACIIPALSPITDSVAQQMEAGQTVIWTNTNSKLQSCVNKFRGQVGGTVTSAYRPQAYQTHLWEIHDRWCTRGLRSNSDSVCSSLKSTVSAEVTKHQLSACYPVSQNTSTHGTGTGVDISGVSNQGSSATISAASGACLRWYGAGDPVHYTLDLTIPGCSCP